VAHLSGASKYICRGQTQHKHGPSNPAPGYQHPIHHMHVHGPDDEIIEFELYRNMNREDGLRPDWSWSLPSTPWKNAGSLCHSNSICMTWVLDQHTSVFQGSDPVPASSFFTLSQLL
jgi:hypothetical protein